MSDNALTVEGQLFDAARNGDVTRLTALLGKHPDRLHAREKPYEWSLLHAAAERGHPAVVDLLLKRGLDVNTRERHHIFSAIAMNFADEVRRIVAADPSALNRRMSRNENNQQPLHFAVRMGRPAMVALLLDLGADPLGVDSGGMPVAGYATAPDMDREVMERIRHITSAERVSAERGHRPPRGSMMDLVALLSLGDWETAALFVHGNRELIEKSGPDGGSLHLLAKRGDARAVKWLLDHGANPNTRWPHWDADVTPLHLAALGGHAYVVRLLLAVGANPSIRDSTHDSDAIGWADFFRQPEIVQILKDHPANR